jgi:hypothetical protein
MSKRLCEERSMTKHSGSPPAMNVSPSTEAMNFLYEIYELVSDYINFMVRYLQMR